MQKCTNCGSTDLEEDRSRGEVACRDCGTVLEENMIVNEVQFQESSGGGASTVIGTFVAADDGGRQMPGFSTSALGFKKESRQVTLSRAKRRLEEVGSLLRMNRRQTDMAYSFYQSALNRGWTRGRQVKLVTAACLYIVCRLEGTSHMLLDLSDVLEINVYTLGKTYMEIAKRLNIQIPALDPCLYIQRFASKMEFGAQTTKVESTAMRLMQRMKKDWISTGRRPSGLAAAALLVAARLHDFNRNYEDVARIARISQQTARKRLAEFGRTASSSLTIEEFLQVDYEEEHDPPAFYEALKRSKVEVEEKDMEALEEEIEELERRIDQELEHLRQRRCRMYGQYLTVTQPAEQPIEPEEGAKLSCLMQNTSEVNLTDTLILRDSLEGVVNESMLDDCVQDLQRLTGAKKQLLKQQQQAAEAEEEKLKTRPVLPVCDTEGMARLVFQESQVEEESRCDTKTEAEQDGTLDLTGIDDEELEKEYILTKREVIIKAREWYRQNADYVQFMKMKAAEARSKAEKEEAEGKDEKKKRKRPTARKKAVNRQHGSAQEAFEAIIKEKKLSTKIDYDALRSRQEERTDSENPPSSAPLTPPAPPASPPAKAARVKAELPSLPTSLRVSRPDSPAPISNVSVIQSSKPESTASLVTEVETPPFQSLSKVESSSPPRKPEDDEAELRLMVEPFIKVQPSTGEVEDDEEDEEEEEEETGENDLIKMLKRGRAQMGGFDEDEEEETYGGYDDGDCDYYDDY